MRAVRVVSTLAAAMSVALAGCASDPGESERTSGPAAASSTFVPSSAAPSSAGPSSARPSPRLSSVPADRRSSVAATTVLATIAVKGRAARTGYDRDAYGPAWTDDNLSPLGHNGCDTRNDILRRDLAPVALRPGSFGCAVLRGTLRDPYTGRTIAFERGPRSADVQIDHVVALSNAWQTGASLWIEATRTALANDPINLLSVYGPTNAAKGDGDAATWLPPNKAYRCAYVARQVAVKARYRLWMTPAEHDAVARVLRSCPGQTAPQEAGRVDIRRATASTPRSTAPRTGAPAGCTRTSGGNCIRGGQFCPRASYGQLGRDASGTAYRCAGDADRPRWTAA